MSTAELKLDLINKITNLKEVRIIKELKNFLDSELEESRSKLNNLKKIRTSKSENDRILTGIGMAISETSLAEDWDSKEDSFWDTF